MCPPASGIRPDEAGCHGKSNREIAAALVLSIRTIERHIENLYAKIGANGGAEATAYALREPGVAG
jgi:DNA-binding NarL/FixJ family response regulator